MGERWCRRTGAAARLRAGLVAAAVAALVSGAPTPAAADQVDESGSREAIDILGVRADDGRIRALFAAPTGPTTQTLTADDVTVRVDDQSQQARLRHLDTTDLEVAAVVDTAVPVDDLRRMQAVVVELALDLPAGTTLRVVDATAAASPPSEVPGAAIAAVEELRAGTTDDLRQAVRTGVRLLDRSRRDRTALLVVGRNLDERLRRIGRQPFRRIVHVVTVDGDEAGQRLLGPRTSGTVRTVDALTGVRAAVDAMTEDLRATYEAELDVSGDVETLAIETASVADHSAAATVTLDGTGVRRDVPDPAVEAEAGDDPPPTVDGAGRATGTDTGAVTSGAAADGVWSDMLAAAADRMRRPAVAVIAVGLTAVIMLLLLGRRLRHAVDRAPIVYRARQWVRAMVTPRVRRRRRPGPEAVDEAAPTTAGTRRPRTATHTTRPIAKLGDETHEALAQAHLGLRRLALASRRAVDSIPDDLFRLAEARASVALGGPAVDLADVLTGTLSDGADSDGAQRVRRAASALEIGWRQAAKPATSPATLREISAALTAVAPNGTGRAPHTSAPVRALNPLVQVGLDHIGLAGRAGRDSALIARAVMSIDIMRAARLARPVLVVSTGLLDDRRRYEAALDADLADPRQRDAWLGLLCASVSRGAVDSADRLARLGRLRDRYRDHTGDRRLLSLVDLVLAQPVIDLDTLSGRLTISREAAGRLVPAAVEAGWLTPHEQLADAWVATEVLDLFRRVPAPRAHSTSAR